MKITPQMAAEGNAAMAAAVREYIQDIGGAERLMRLDDLALLNAFSQALTCSQQARRRWVEEKVLAGAYPAPSIPDEGDLAEVADGE